MDQRVKKRLSLPEGASSKHLPVTKPNMKVIKQRKFRSLRKVYEETSRQKYTMKQVEKLSKETQDLKTDRLGRKNGEESNSKRKGSKDDESLLGNKKVQNFQKLSRFGKKLPSQTGGEADMDNCVGNDQIHRTTTRNVHSLKVATSEVLRHQAIKRNELASEIENDNERCERRLKRPAASIKKTISYEKVIISEGGNQQSGNILLNNKIKDTTGGSSVQRGKGKPMNDTTRELDKAHICETELNGIMKGISPATGKGDLVGKTCLKTSYISDISVSASPMSGISTNSNSAVIFKNVELQKQDSVSETFGSNSINGKDIATESTRKRKVRFWGMDLDSDTMKSTKAAKTCVVTNTNDLDKMQIVDVTPGLNSSDGFMSSMISNQPASPKEMDFLNSIGDGASGHLMTPRADHAPNMNIFSSEKHSTLSAAPVPVPKASPSVAAANMNSINNDRRLGFIQHQPTNSFTVSQRSSFAPYNRQTIRNNIPTPLTSTHTLAAASHSYGAPSNSQEIRINNSSLPASSSFVPNSSAPTISSRPDQGYYYYWGNPYCPVFLMVLGAGPWTGGV